MEELTDLKIRKFEEFLINYINSVEELAIEVKRLVIFEILEELEKESDKAIIAQQISLKNNKEAKKSDAESVQ